MKILIATQNREKYHIVSRLIESVLAYKIDFASLNDLKEKIIEQKEAGSIEERASQKALNVYNNLITNDYDYIVGVDDGILMKNELHANIRDYLDAIVNHNYLNDGEIVCIVRVFAFVNKLGEVITITTRIPFEYKKIDIPVNIVESTYPLSRVLTPLGNPNITVTDMNEAEISQYYLKYSTEALKKGLEIE
jgi:predicted dinucleotide-utilizing enzyme